jgi:hypothetical protein
MLAGRQAAAIIIIIIILPFLLILGAGSCLPRSRYSNTPGSSAIIR